MQQQVPEWVATIAYAVLVLSSLTMVGLLIFLSVEIVHDWRKRH